MWPVWLVQTVATRVISGLVRRGLLSVEDEAWAEPDRLVQEEPAVAACYAAAIQGRMAFGAGAGQRLPRLGAIPGGPWIEPDGPLQARFRGFDLHAEVAVPAGDRERLERLCRYMARPPLAHDRLERLPDGRIALRLKRPFSDGSTHVVFTAEALIERLCALVPRPRTHRVRYHGLLAPASPLRRLVVPPLAQETAAHRPIVQAAGSAPERDSVGKRFRWVLWAELLRRVFDVDPLVCPNCSGRMKVIAAILKAEIVAKILHALGVPAEPPEIRRARSPPDHDLVEYDLS
jgi:hypothetical protein